jgi:uncharacterized membrane protein YeiH
LAWAAARSIKMMRARVPEVLRADIYATAALVGAAAMVISCKFTRPSTSGLRYSGGTVRFLLRVISVWQHRNLPRRSSGSEEKNSEATA